MSVVDRALSLADEPTDDDDRRLRKRVAIAAAYVLSLAALQLPLIAQGHPLSLFIAISMPLVNAVNLVVLARTRRFDRYVAVLVVTVLVVAAFTEVALGGLRGSSASIVFAFLAPVLALLALGPKAATPWFIAFVATLLVVILLDPIVSSRMSPQPYPMRLVWYAANLVIPLGLTFAMLRYTDLRRRRAEARSEELLTNAIPASIAARLKRGEGRIAESYPATTVLFADLAGFTPWARETDPDQVVDFLDKLFSQFDNLAAECGVEKIKTIGDAYMAVAGLRRPDPTMRWPRWSSRAACSRPLPRLATDQACRSSCASASPAGRWSGASSGNSASSSTFGVTRSTPLPGCSARASPGVSTSPRRHATCSETPGCSRSCRQANSRVLSGLGSFVRFGRVSDRRGVSGLTRTRTIDPWLPGVGSVAMKT